MNRGVWLAIVHGVAKSQTQLSNYAYLLTYSLYIVIHFLGTQGISLRVCGAENPSQGPWEPGGIHSSWVGKESDMTEKLTNFWAQKSGPYLSRIYTQS